MIFNRDYIIRKGSTFSKEILLSDIYVTLEPATTYTTEGGMILAADDAVKQAIVVTLSAENTIMTISITSALTTTLANLGNYNYAIDIINSGVVQTVLEGIILVKEDNSKTT